jgi:RNA polymerase sigma-70 factor (ECF subfamily)
VDERLDDFDMLYRTHAPGVFRRAEQLLRSEAEAREVVQDLFLSLYERPQQFAGRSKLTSFLYAATTNACLNRLRNQRNRARLTAQHLHAPDIDPGPTPDALSALRSALGRMPGPLAQVAVFYYFDELTHEEIARLLGCSARHVGNLVQRVDAWQLAQEQQLAQEYAK